MSDYVSTNEMRADRVRPILDTYRKMMGDSGSDDEQLTDLVTDLLHLADRTEDLSAIDLIERAAYHHAAECEEEVG